MNTRVFKPEHSIILYRSSYLSAISTLYAFHRGYYHLTVGPGAVFLTSIHYWRDPDYSYRRYLDMVTVQCALWYQNIQLYNAEYANVYYMIMLCAIAMFPISQYYHYRSDHLKSVYFHMMIHILGNTANIVVFSGNIVNDTNAISSPTLHIV
jgi:hypothetical protein